MRISKISSTLIGLILLNVSCSDKPMDSNVNEVKIQNNGNGLNVNSKDLIDVSESKNIEYLAYSDEGTPILAKVIDKKTGKYEIIGLGNDYKVAHKNLMSNLELDPAFATIDFKNQTMTFRLVAGLRLKFPDLIGFRVGFLIGELVELGTDAGSSIVATNAGGYMTVYPFKNQNNALRGLYLSGRYYYSNYFLIIESIQTTSVEGVVGYKFDKKPGGFYSYVESGINVNISDRVATSPLGGYTSDERKVIPVVGFGVGWRL